MGEITEILSVEEAADIAGVSAGRTRQLIAEGRLKAKKIGNSWAILPRDLDAFLGRQRGPGRPNQRAALESKLSVELRPMSPIQITLFPPSPEIRLWFRVDNRSDV